MLLNQTPAWTLAVIISVIFSSTLYYFLKRRNNKKSAQIISFFSGLACTIILLGISSKVTIITKNSEHSYYCYGNLNYDFANHFSTTLKLNPGKYYIINDMNIDVILETIYFSPKRTKSYNGILIPANAACLVPTFYLNYSFNDTPPNRINNMRGWRGKKNQAKYWLRTKEQYTREHGEIQYGEIICCK
jgi:hypothetical protein